jgi:transcriptional regulator with XRE-family HTH domain
VLHILRLLNPRPCLVRVCIDLYVFVCFTSGRLTGQERGGVETRIRQIRAERGWTVRRLAQESGVDKNTISEAERGLRNPNPITMHKLAGALGVEVSDLLRRAAWDAAVVEGRRLRETGQGRMSKALSEWSASEQRGEPYAARREYLDEMEDLLQEAYGAYTAVGEAYIEAALTQGGSEAKVPSYLREESRTMGHFYGELLGLVKSAGLSVRTGVASASAKRDAKARSETTPHSVEEPKAA